MFWPRAGYLILELVSVSPPFYLLILDAYIVWEWELCSGPCVTLILHKAENLRASAPRDGSSFLSRQCFLPGAFCSFIRPVWWAEARTPGPGLLRHWRPPKSRASWLGPSKDRKFLEQGIANEMLFLLSSRIPSLQSLSTSESKQVRKDSRLWRPPRKNKTV